METDYFFFLHGSNEKALRNRLKDPLAAGKVMQKQAH